MDKRRPDLRDELGYIAPPNRKLPPVPGSNYNTCDRIKRGTVISKPLLPTILFLDHYYYYHRFYEIQLVVVASARPFNLFHIFF